MGLFFDPGTDKTPSQPTQPVQQNQSFWSAAGLAILTFFLAALTWILKPLLSWLFDFHGVDRQLGTLKVMVILVIFGGGALMLYKIPKVRDTMTLSETHTVNLIKTERIPFPDRAYFVPTGERKQFEYAGNTFVTYTGYNEHLAFPMEPGYCHLVPRGEKVLLASRTFPVYAAGFEDVVTYNVSRSVASLSFSEFRKAHLLHPWYFAKSPQELAQTSINYTAEENWKEFENSWEYLWVISAGNKPFTLKARDNEHAIICF